MKKIYLVIACSLLLVACGGADSGTEVETITVSSLGRTTTIDKENEYNLSISGLNNTITIGPNNNINSLVISGLNNSVTINNGTTVKVFSVSGSDNTVYVQAGSGISFNDSGLGNQLIVQ